MTFVSICYEIRILLIDNNLSKSGNFARTRFSD